LSKTPISTIHKGSPTQYFSIYFSICEYISLFMVFIGAINIKDFETTNELSPKASTEEKSTHPSVTSFPLLFYS
jgi:hypothetical protein